jgi:hypothetical protein
MKNRRKLIATRLVMAAWLLGLMFSTSVTVSVEAAAHGAGQATEGESCERNRSGYEVREIHYGQALMREFVTPSGVVFALDWDGMIKPDVEHLLGSSPDERLRDLLPIPGESKLRSHIPERDIVRRRSGTPDDPHGRAYVPYLVPPGVKMEEAWHSG